VVLEGYNSTEAALGLNVSAAAIRSLLLRSRSKLQEALEE
jgi:DNA-directed RNA polymerase specialized sigma24 family protein